MAVRSVRGFTLAELLITLLILGEIATFTIPKIITSQQNGQYRSATKETAAMISGAFQQAQLAGGVTTSTTFGDLTPYMNYLGVDSSTPIDDISGFGSKNCASGTPCLKLHQGGLLRYDTAGSFGGSGANNALLLFYDVDGLYSGSTTGNSKAIRLVLYYTGRITSIGQLNAAVSSSNDGIGTGFPDPTWFSW